MVATTGNELSDQIAAANGVGGVVCEHNLAGEDWVPQHAVAGVVDCCWVLLYGCCHIWKKLNLLSKTKSTSLRSITFKSGGPLIKYKYLNEQFSS